jgi:hypothetical protein
MLGVVKMGRGSEVRTRDDPFVTFDPPPQPVPVELVVNPPPVALQDGGLRPVGGMIDVADLGIGMNRVSGLLFNEGAYAILESGRGEAFVVKPGDVVQGHRITAIARDSIYLTDPDSRRWRVPLRSKDPGGAPAARISTTIRGMPETPLGGL